MKIKTSELIGSALDWAVAKCENRTIGYNIGGGLQVRGRTENDQELPDNWDLWYDWHPSTDWSQGGPIIEREEIDLASPNPIDPSWCAMQWSFSHGAKGTTPLIAAMRCYVTSKLGNEVDIPDELVIRTTDKE